MDFLMATSNEGDQLLVTHLSLGSVLGFGGEHLSGPGSCLRVRLAALAAAGRWFLP